jgi:hypothetical protein
MGLSASEMPTHYCRACGSRDKAAITLPIVRVAAYLSVAPRNATGRNC